MRLNNCVGVKRLLGLHSFFFLAASTITSLSVNLDEGYQIHSTVIDKSLGRIVTAINNNQTFQIFLFRCVYYFLLIRLCLSHFKEIFFNMFVNSSVMTGNMDIFTRPFRALTSVAIPITKKPELTQHRQIAEPTKAV